MGVVSKLFFPQRCAFCGEVSSSASGVCERCESEIPIIDTPKCKRCGCGEDRCSCTPIINHYDRIIAPLYYDGIVKKMITQIKKYSSQESTQMAVSFMAEECRRSYKINFDAVTAVPTDRLGFVKRGYNPAEYVASMLANELSLPYKPLLKKHFTLSSQKSSDRIRRLENISGAYYVTDNVQDKNILLVDDVKTTGATLNECSRMLKLSGAKRVYVAVVCITGKS